MWCAAIMGIPIVGAAVNSGLLSGSDLFVRTAFSYDAAGQLAGAIARFTGLRSVGAITTRLFRSIENHLENRYLNTTSCGNSKYACEDSDLVPTAGFVLYEAAIVHTMRAKMDMLYTSGCR